MLQNVRKRKARAKHVYKTALSVKAKTLPTTQLCLWFLLLCTVVVLTLTPIFGARKSQVDAGQSSEGTQFTNAPWVKVNTGNALFISNANGGGVSAETLYDLLLQVNKSQVWVDSTTNLYKMETSTQNTSVTENTYYLSAKNFSKLDEPHVVADGLDAITTAQLQLKLFDGATLGAIETTDNSGDGAVNIDGASSLFYQAVYRSMDSSKDVLTLYINSGYGSAYFDNTPDSSGNYYAYYTDSNLREVVQGTYSALTNAYSNLNSFVVAPDALPGKWQSSAYQTYLGVGVTIPSPSDNFNAGVSYLADTTSAIKGVVNNGLDGLTDIIDDEATATNSGTWYTRKVLHNTWTEINDITTENTPYKDKFWVPSAYEVIYRSAVTDAGPNSASSSSADATLSGGNTGGTDEELDGRSGLWELNGYDRASGGELWTRSGSRFSSKIAVTLTNSGSVTNIMPNSSINVSSSKGVRAALHLDIRELADEYLSKITANQLAADGTSSAITAIVTANETRQNVLSTHNYSNYTVPSATADNYKKVITFNAASGETQVKSFTLKAGNIEKTINVVGVSGSGTRETTKDLCDYSYTYENGQLKVTVSNVQTRTLNVQANVDRYTTLNLSVTNSAPNSLLVLHFFNGSDKLGECSFVYSGGAQTASITLPRNETIRILATKPFTSRARFELGGSEITAVGTSTWEIPTGTSSTLTLTVTLTGDGSWSNAIII